MSTVLANTITAVGGGGSTVKVNNDSTLISDGGAVTDHNLVQGLVKGWMNLDGSGTAAILDSFNVSGFTDNGTGDYTHTHTNAMNNALYSVSISSKRATSTNNSGSQHQDGTFTTAAFRMLFVEFDNDPSHDVDMAFTMVAGDLA